MEQGFKAIYQYLNGFWLDLAISLDLNDFMGMLAQTATKHSSSACSSESSSGCSPERT
jgi:hypothetical protein